MKHAIFTLTVFTLLAMVSCRKDLDADTTRPSSNSRFGQNASSITGHSLGRISSTNYSQSIPLDTANYMLQSYLTSVGYPSVDTAIRSLTFDADTLRAYLQDPDIVSLKLMFAHQPGYISSGNQGVHAGMRPDGLTMIVVGLDNSEQYVLNNRNEVYEHFAPCPHQCPVAVNDPYVY